jgi:mannose-6-phosphate isomerase-like protein (cupin superfamily)|tara:strand:- start:6852 stop:7184 length:333 start_codon:yes stop_codon:yes gene_type:complete
MIKVSMKDVGGETIKDNAQYVLKDNAFGNNLILSSTFLRANQKTNGHAHAGQEEVYFFVDGKGEMQVNDERFPVEGGDVICIEDGDFHRVFNTGHLGLYFVCVFDGGRNH